MTWTLINLNVGCVSISIASLHTIWCQLGYGWVHLMSISIVYNNRIAISCFSLSAIVYWKCKYENSVLAKTLERLLKSTYIFSYLFSVDVFYSFYWHIYFHISQASMFPKRKFNKRIKKTESARKFIIPLLPHYPHNKKET